MVAAVEGDIEALRDAVLAFQVVSGAMEGVV